MLPADVIQGATVGAVAMNVLAFLAYGFDKARARGGGRRVRETTLHLLAVLGGWPGALLAQAVFRHKTVKRSFRAVFWCTVAVNVGAVAAIVYLLDHGLG